jgi:universal stress protein A
MSVKKILCCTDFSENAEAAFAMAADMAKKYGASLHIVHVIPPVINPLIPDAEWISVYEPTEGFAGKIEERLRQEYMPGLSANSACEFVVLSGHVSSEIVRYSKEIKADLVIMGSYGLTGMGLVLFGSVAERVSRKASCSVMIVRPHAKE